MNSIWVELLGADVRQAFYDVKGIRTRALEAGAGEPVIFLHGIGGHAEAYARNIVPHAAHFRVYALDMLGHGFTDAPDIAYSLQDLARHLGDFIDIIDAPRVALSGESLGAMVATHYAVQHPERVSKLVLNTGMIAPRDEKGMQQLRDLRDRSLKASETPTRETVRNRLNWLMANPETSVSDELVEIRYRIYSQPGRPAMMKKMSQTMMKIGDEDPEHWAAVTDATVMRGLKCPTFVVWSRHNPGRSAEEAAESAREIPDARMVVLENSAHWPQWEEHELFNRLHLDFLQS